MKKGGAYFAGQKTRADIDPGIFVDKAQRELLAIGAFLPDYFRAFQQSFVIDDQGPAFPAMQILRFVETEGRKMARGSQRIAFVARTYCLGRILDKPDAMPVRYLPDAIRRASDATVVDDEDRLRLTGYGLLDPGFIHVHGIGADIHEYRYRTPEHKGIGTAHKREAGHDDFIAGLNVDQKCGHFQGGGAGRGQ